MLDLLRDGHGLEPWAPTGSLRTICHNGDAVVAAVDLDEKERQRRRRYGLGALPRRSVLEVLLSLPGGVSVPMALLSTSAQRTIDAMPRGVVDVDDDQVRAVLTPALWLRSVGVVASTWTAGLRRSSAFASYCSRYVVLDTGGRRLQEAATQAAAMEARFYGIGLAVHRDEEISWLVSPAPFAADRFSAASWLMTERILEGLHAAPA